MASLSRCDAHVSPPCAHLSQLGDALPVAIVGDVVAKHERVANQVGEDRVRVRVREDVVEEVLRDRLLGVLVRSSGSVRATWSRGSVSSFE